MHAFVNIAGRLKQRARHRLPTLWLMTDAVRLTDPEAAVARLPKGAGVIIRHPDARKRRDLARRLVPLCRRRGVICLIAGDWRLAAAVGADGVHLPDRMTRLGVDGGALLWRRQRGCLLTTAAHGFASLLRGARLKADGIFLAPVFPTASHPDGLTLGVTGFAAMLKHVPVPVIALGGITARNVRRLTQSGAAGLAGIDWIKT